MYAQLRGNSQSLVKVVSGGLPRDPASQPPIVENDAKVSALIDGRGSFGIIAMQLAVDTALAKVAEHGVAIVGTHGTSSGTGALGYWANRIADSGLVAVVLSQSPEYVAPYGSSEAIYGTNPIAFGVPRPGKDPLIFDMATSSTSLFALVEARRAGRPVPEDIGFDADGNVTTDASAILDGGAMHSFDRSYKGSHLALMVELVAGPLVGAAVVDKATSDNWGNLVVALDPAIFGDAAVFRDGVETMLQRVLGAKPLSDDEEVRLPGEASSQSAAARLDMGYLPVNKQLLVDLRALAAEAPADVSPEDLNSNQDKEQSRVHSQVPETRWEDQPRGMSTNALHTRRKPTIDPYQAMSPPIYQTATFGQPSATEGGPFDYTRSGNPTRTLFEAQVADLEGADRSLAFTSGMAALSAVVRLVAAGQHIIAGDDLYGGTSRLLQRIAPSLGITVSNVDMTDTRNVREAIIPGKTALVMVESPTNPRMCICDIAAIASIAHNAGAICSVDNSMMAPVFQRPLDLGADISMTSITKFIGGHSDITGGILSVKGADLSDRVYFVQNAEGAGLSPYDSWLSARGLKTMALRMERQASNCAALAAYLNAHPLVRKVNYAGLDSHPGASVHRKQATSAGSLLSFTTDNVEVSKVIVEETQLYNIVVSFGSVTSSISLPCFMSHASIPAEVRAARGLPDDLVRISVGIEDVDDLLIDLHQAMQKAMTKVGMPLDDGPKSPFDHKPVEGDEVAALRAQLQEMQATIAVLRSHT